VLRCVAGCCSVLQCVAVSANAIEKAGGCAGVRTCKRESARAGESAREKETTTCLSATERWAAHSCGSGGGKD